MAEPDSASRPMWQRHWFQVLLACLLGLFVLSFVLPAVWSFIYATRSVLLPLVIAFGLAYIVNPLVRWAQRRLRMPRWASVTSVIAVGLMVLTLLGLAIVPSLVNQGQDLIQNARNVYPARLAEWMGLNGGADQVASAEPPWWAPESLHFIWVDESETADAGDEGDGAVADAPSSGSDQAVGPESAQADGGAEGDPQAQAGDGGAATGNPAGDGSAAVDASGAELTSTEGASSQAAEQPAETGLPPGIAAPSGGDQPEAQPTEPSEISSFSELWETQQIQRMIENAQHYLQNLEWRQVADFLVRSLDIGVGVAGAAISITSYLLVAGIIILFCFVFFCIHFDSILDWFKPFIPASYRERTLDIAAKMDKSVSSFVRGRLVQATILSVVLSVGWWIVGVPSPLLLGVVSGFLNLIPYAAAIGFLAALALTAIDQVASGGGSMLWVLGWATVVYLIAQGLDGWVIEPMIQGKATNLDPVTVLLVVLLGASLAGLLGMLIAIPVAACIKILAREIVLPKLRRIASRN